MADTPATSPQAVGKSRRRLSWPGLTFSIRQLLIGTAFVAVSCLALRGANAWWVSTALSMAVVGLVVGLLLAIYRQQGERAFWTGFCLTGAAYLALVLYVWHLAASESIRSSHPLRSDRRLPTGSLSEWTYEWLYEQPMAAAADSGAMYGSGMGDMYSSGYASSGSYDASGYGADYGSGYGGEMGSGMPGAADGGYGGSMGMPGMDMMGGYPGSQPEPPWKPDEKDFINVAHSLWAIVLATAGGWIALVIYTSGQRREAVGQASSLL